MPFNNVTRKKVADVVARARVSDLGGTDSLRGYLWQRPMIWRMARYGGRRPALVGLSSSIKPGKGPAFVHRCSVRQTVRRDARAGLKIETATVDRRDMTYLYQDGTDCIFMSVHPSR